MTRTPIPARVSATLAIYAARTEAEHDAAMARLEEAREAERLSLPRPLVGDPIARRPREYTHAPGDRGSACGQPGTVTVCGVFDCPACVAEIHGTE